MLLFLALGVLGGMLPVGGLPVFPQSTAFPDVPCSSKEVCVKEISGKCHLRTGILAFNNLPRDKILTCAAPMRCMRDWKTEDEGICVLVSAGMPCLMNNFLGDCGTMLEAPNSYCVEGTCRQPPSFPGDHCYIAQECTGGATCVNNQCVGVPLDGLCTNQYRLCDRLLYCPNELPGHAKCRPQKALGETCATKFSIESFEMGTIGTNECQPGLHCSDKKCIRNSDVRSGLGQPCTGRTIMNHMERVCEDKYYCHPLNRTCVEWPERVWFPCRNVSDCGEGLECNCKVGGINVCEVPMEEGVALADFVERTSEGVTKCLADNNCWRGLSAYPYDIFNIKSCAWLNCRKEMAKHMHAQFCNTSSSLPQYRDCVMDGWCDRVMGWTKVDKETPPPATPAPEDMIEKLNPTEIAAIIVGSLILTLLVFFSGFIFGWLRSRFKQWKGKGDNDGGAVEFSKLDNFASTRPEI